MYSNLPIVLVSSDSVCVCVCVCVRACVRACVCYECIGDVLTFKLKQNVSDFAEVEKGRAVFNTFFYPFLIPSFGCLDTFLPFTIPSLS